MSNLSQHYHLIMLKWILITHLTDEGYNLINNILPSHAALIAQDLAVLTAAEQDPSGRLCKKPGLSGKS